MADPFAQKFTMYSDTVQGPVWNFWGSDSDQAMINKFVTSIREQRQPCITGYKATLAVVVAYLSAHTTIPPSGCRWRREKSRRTPGDCFASLPDSRYPR